MAIDSFLVAFSFAAGAATFFSPCSVGLFPAYIGFYLSLDERMGREPSSPNGGSSPKRPVFKALSGVRLGLIASLGFLLLFLATGAFVSLVGVRFLGPYLRWISIGIGVVIITLGLLQLSGKGFGISIPVRAPRNRTALSIFAFGIGYALASLGCTLPVFLATLFASLTAAGGLGALLVLLAYGAGMGLVMVVVTASLAVSEEAATTYVRRLVPLIKSASSLLLMLAGAVIIYFYAVVWV